jgi:O-antigen/teichoic acid export membrane protein
VALNVRETLALVRKNALVRQNTILFAGGLVAGLGSFVYHAIAGRILGPTAYGQVASLIAAYAIGLTFAVILALVLARHTATLAAKGEGGVGWVWRRSAAVVAIPCLALLVVAALVARSIADFEHMSSAGPVLILGLAIALGWQVAIPRGILQGLQRFQALAANLALDPVVRVSALWILLGAGYAVAGAMVAVAVGMAAVLALGIWSLRDHLGDKEPPLRSKLGAGFSLTAAAGVVGIQLLFNQDVVLAEHYLPSHEGGIYGGLNKIGTIVFYLTLSVSQVLFPRVVDAVARHQNPGRLLLASAGILTAIGAAALLVFAVAPGLVVSVLYGPGFRDATPYVVAVGVIGLALSLDNMLVQFFMAVHDRWFVPILALGCATETALLVRFHGGVGQVVVDVLLSLVGLLAVLVIRCIMLLPALRAPTTVAVPDDPL